MVQPALFAVMVSLAELWRSLGVEPDAVVGHSQGEIAAAAVAGVLSLDDAAMIVAVRSQAIAELAGRGAMASVPLPADEARALAARWHGRVEIAAVNGPRSVAVSGDPGAVGELIGACETEGVRARRIGVDYASHCAQVGAIRDRFLNLLGDVAPGPPRIAFCSTVTGEWSMTPSSMPRTGTGTSARPFSSSGPPRVARPGLPHVHRGQSPSGARRSDAGDHRGPGRRCVRGEHAAS